MDYTKPIVALDFATVDEIEAFLSHFEGVQLNVKVGMETYFMYGGDLVKKLKGLGHSVFLDLKLHDIPNTVRRSMRNLARLGVDMVNVHASGGKDMMEAARLGLEEGSEVSLNRPILIAVTQLTSTSQQQLEEEQLVSVSLEESVRHYAELTKQAGLDGIVCSPLEAKQIRRDLGDDFITVTPGIRPVNNQVKSDDQHRTATPKEAAELGSHYLVIGRPITQAEHPRDVYESMAHEWQNALGGRR